MVVAGDRTLSSPRLQLWVFFSVGSSPKNNYMSHVVLDTRENLGIERPARIGGKQAKSPWRDHRAEMPHASAMAPFWVRW
jgi:hypothetical protein